jgi:glycine/D-amino acid oxidase-like deaminating enzyme
MTPDENFIVDEEDGLVIIAGFSGHGFKFASVIGEIAKDLALNGKTKHPTDFLRFRW